MKTAKESVTLRINHKHQRKDNTFQLLFEIRNYTPQPVRINCLNSNREIMHIQKTCLKLGKVVNTRDAGLLNAYFTKVENRIRLVLDYLNFFSLPLTKQNIESYLYFKFSDVFAFYENVTDADSAKEYITNYFVKTPEQHQAEALVSAKMAREANQNSIDNYEALKKIDPDFEAYKPSGICEAVDMLHYENIRTDKIVPIIKKYCEHIKWNDLIIEKFTAELFDTIILYACKNPIAKPINNEPQYYSVNTIKDFVKHTKILFKNFKRDGYKVDENIFDINLRIGIRKNSHIAFNYNERQNVIAIYGKELQAIKAGNFTEKLPKLEYDKLEKARKLFLIQTMLGGLRLGELKLIKKENFFKMNGKTYLNLRSPKTSKTIDSPLHNELEPLLQEINYDIESLMYFKNAESGNYNDGVYNSDLRKMCQMLGLNREVDKKESKVNQTYAQSHVKKLYEVFSSKMARKALVTILFESGLYTLEQIATITNHSTEAIKNYLAVLTCEKEKMINTL